MAEAPRVRHPSVVACAPDGRVFVAEDPMDISLPRADLAQGRILCLHPDGRLTVFAEGLYAVFGMQYLEGKLFALHNPRFSVFGDGGTSASGREDLIESTNPDPWALNWNDHVPAGFRLAMDGFLYVAVGDKGVYGAVGRDGRRVDLHGGGILRLRPDGTELEVHSTGVRNILDVALDEEDELFTYDNTDEDRWMSRLTHMVEGGFYGYPWEFVPPRASTLPCLADYGPGAATGALAYCEDALPELRGSLFLADFGKRQVMRVELEREGATWRARTREDLFRDPPEGFRPVGIALSPDGLSLYICDWNHRDTKEEVAVGRLLKLSWLGPGRAAPRPSWFLPASLGRPVEASVGDLLQGLSHPSHGVRLLAQRLLARRGKAAEEPLAHLLLDARAPPEARRHAVWALDGIEGGRAGIAAVLGAARPGAARQGSEGEASVRRQAVRRLGFRRVMEAEPLLLELLRDPDAPLRFHALTALGRLASPRAVPALLETLGREEDAFIRFAAFTALARTGRSEPASWAAVVRGLSSPEPRVREGAALALRGTHHPALVEALAAYAKDAEAAPEGRAEALRLLAPVHLRLPPWRGEWWAYHPARSAPPRKTETWEGSGAVLAALRAALSDRRADLRAAAAASLAAAGAREAGPDLRHLLAGEPDAAVRRSALAALGALADREAGPLVASRIREGPEEEILEAVRAAAGVGGAEVVEALVALLEGPRARARPALLAALEVLGALRAPAAVPALARHAREPDQDLRRAALDSLGKVPGGEAAQALAALLDESSPAVRREALAVLGQRGAKEALPRILAAHREAETRWEAVQALSAMPDARALEAYLDGLGSPGAALRAACARALGALGDSSLPAIEARLQSLSPPAILELRRAFEKSAAARSGPLFSLPLRGLSRAEYLERASQGGGDPSRGKRLFSDLKGAACVRCHAVNGEGGRVGPDLGGVGGQLSRGEIAEELLEPSRRVREGYAQAVLVMRDGRLLAGLIKGETPEVVSLADVEGRLLEVPRAEVERREASAASLMPEGIEAALSLEELVDLVAYLESLKGPEAR